MHPLIYISSMEKYTVSIGLNFLKTSGTAAEKYSGEPTEHLLMAGTMLAALPCLAIFFALQRYFIRGVIMSGIKG